VTRRFALLVNPLSAGGKPLKVLPEVLAELERGGVEHRVVETNSLEHALEEARTAAETGETVMTLGGDGLVGPVAGVLRGGSAALAVLPGGRGNDFARALGIPQNPAEAVRVALEGEERRVDVAAVNGAPYVGIASLGFDSDANRIANEARLVRGSLAYAYAALRTLASWTPATFSVRVDGNLHRISGYSVAVGNSKYFGGGMMLLPEAKLDDGQLDVLLLSRTSKLRYARGVAQVFTGEHLDPRFTQIVRGSVVEIDADRPFAVYADGDHLGDTPVTVTIDPGSLRIVAARL
jgi:YegS/Rv2252/BmrU family lipid kinase